MTSWSNHASIASLDPTHRLDADDSLELSIGLAPSVFGSPAGARGGAGREPSPADSPSHPEHEVGIDVLVDRLGGLVDAVGHVEIVGHLARAVEGVEAGRFLEADLGLLQGEDVGAGQGDGVVLGLDADLGFILYFSRALSSSRWSTRVTSTPIFLPLSSGKVLIPERAMIWSLPFE